jgi:hypothetical protein
LCASRYSYVAYQAHHDCALEIAAERNNFTIILYMVPHLTTSDETARIAFLYLCRANDLLSYIEMR